MNLKATQTPASYIILTIKAHISWRQHLCGHIRPYIAMPEQIIARETATEFEIQNMRAKTKIECCNWSAEASLTMFRHLPKGKVENLRIECVLAISLCTSTS